MKRHILLFALLLCSVGRIGAQDSGSNWIKTRTAISETGTAITDITYYNGLGLPSQTANVRASVNGYNIVTPVAYDALLRSDATAYLPYEATYSDETELPNSTAVSEQQTFYEERYGYDYERSFTEKIYETSPLGRVRKQALPGYMKDFEVLYTEFDYRTNDTDEVRRLSVNGSGELVCEGCYDAGTLSCTESVNADGHIAQTFVDGQGQTLLTRTFDDNDLIDTYSVYDDAGRLRWVVTPEGSNLLSDSQTFAANDDFAEKYCYIYTYDDRGRMIEKQLPGREPEYMVYDLGDRLIMSQDGNLRAQDQWIVYCYDDFGRLTEQRLGTVPDSSEGPIGAFENNPLFLYMTFTNDPAVPVLRSCTYDSYPSHLQTSGLGFQTINGLTSEDGASLRYENAQGAMTYEKLAVLADGAISGYHERAYYYDYKGRVIQTVERDAEEGILCTSQRYDFIGNILAQQERYSNVNSAIDDCIDRIFTYDDRSRLLSETTQVNDGEEAVVTYSYDALGQLSGKTYGTGTSAIHETIAYTIQGWQTAKSSELFDMTLGFYDTEKPSYTGNITSWQWQHKGDPSGNGPQNRYVFTYDDLSRLTNTDQYVNNEKTRQNVERCLSYDRNGNLLTIIRYIDSIQTYNRRYTYNGNRLYQVEKDKVIEWDDFELQPGGPAIVLHGNAETDGPTSTLNVEINIDTNMVIHPADPEILRTRYAHDHNGNLTYDLELETDFTYNNLNLLEKVIQNDTIVAKYSYLWDGTKLSVTNSGNCSCLYRGSFTYREVIENGTSCQVENVPFSSGYIVATEENTEVRYFLTDHLGSVRVVATDKDNVLERNDYYPFGLRHPASLMPISDNRVRFNGKEDQIFIGEYLSDYGVRCYNKLNGRWLMPDPLAEKYFNITQYSFCINNPINYIDLWGLDIWTTNDPDLIRLIIEGIRSTGRIDTSGMNHYTDEEFLNADIDADIYMNQTDNGDYYIVWKTSDNSGVQVNTFKIPFLCSADFWDFDDLNSYMQSSKDTGKDKNLHPIISGIGFTAAVGEQVMYSDFGTWMGRDWKIRSQRWGGNRFTGGKLRYAKRVSKYFKWLGYGATLISMADTEMLYDRELITNKQRWISHGSDIMSSLPYGLGLGWTIGWESGQLVQQYTK